MLSTIQVTVNDELRKDSDKLFKGLGIDTASANRIFLKQAVMYQGFPFEIRMPQRNPYEPLTEDQFYTQLAKSRKAAAECKVRDADDMIADMRKK